MIFCRHRRLAFPQTEINRRTGVRGATSVVCLGCARRFRYDMEAMRMGEEIREVEERPVRRTEREAEA